MILLVAGGSIAGCDPVELEQRPLPRSPAEAESAAESTEMEPVGSESPAPDAFTALFGEVIELETTPASTGASVVWRARAIAPGTARIGLEVGPVPRTFPVTREIVVLPRGEARELGVTPESTVLSVGDTLRLTVPAGHPAPVWVEGLPSLDVPPAARRSRATQPPRSIEALAPTLREPRTAEGAEAALVTYWLTAAEPGVVPIALPLMYSSPELRVVPAEESVEVRVDLTGAPRVAPIQMATLRVGDRVGIRYLRP